MKQFQKFIPITKIDAAKREVYGLVTSEAPDKDGEICDYPSTKPNYQAWSAEFAQATAGKSLGNVREMHAHSAVGKVVDLVFDDPNKTIAVRARIVDDTAWAKCQEGVYTGFSHGGEYVGDPWPDGNYLRYTAKPSEISLVDNPCNPEAHFEYIKADGSIELRKFAEVARTASSAGPVAKRDVSDKERERLAAEGKAMPDGSYPIANEEDLKNAIQAFGRAKDPEAVKRHIISRARSLGLTDLLPEDWEGSTKGNKDDDGAAKVANSTPAAGAACENCAHCAKCEKCAKCHEAQMDGKSAGATPAEKQAGALPPPAAETLEKRAETDPVARAVLEQRQQIADLAGAVQNLTAALSKSISEPLPRKTAGPGKAVTKEQDSEPVNHNPEFAPSTEKADPTTGDKNVLKTCLAQPIALER
jgi:hypothetical protein